MLYIYRCSTRTKCYDRAVRKIPPRGVSCKLACAAAALRRAKLTAKVWGRFGNTRSAWHVTRL